MTDNRTDLELKVELKRLGGNTRGNLSRERIIQRLNDINGSDLPENTNNVVQACNEVISHNKEASQAFVAELPAEAAKPNYTLEELKALYPEAFKYAVAVSPQDAEQVGTYQPPHETHKPISIFPDEPAIQRQPAINAVLGYTPPVQPAPKFFGGCSQEQVLAAVKPNIDRGMTVSFADNTWTFKLKNRVDCGTMSQPVGSIQKCADLVCRESIDASRLKLT